MRYGEPVATESGEIFSAVSEFVKAFKREADLILVTARGLQRYKLSIFLNVSIFVLSKGGIVFK